MRRALDNPRRAIRVFFTERTADTKTGPMPACMVSSNTCPLTCPWLGNGCYGEHNHLGRWWARTNYSDNPEHSMPWGRFCKRVRGLREELWRYGIVGDLPGLGNEVDLPKLRQLADANAVHDNAAIAYTHKLPKYIHQLRAYQYAIAQRFIINLSLDRIEDVDLWTAKLAKQHATIPLTVVVPSDFPRRHHTPGGTLLEVCPAQCRDDMTCKRCRVCANPHRRHAVGFRAHGQAIRKIDQWLLQPSLPGVLDA
jgi:hypothetical protein